ncbi:DNA sulfur modification protein DndE [Leptolyngbya sp. NK1-12]|uniref:DNA sulfur modification protein DndE n=1 Tax=Leptolyngbya sp. NK1-12 TaxID=2547451 RepID=A0AA96WIP9_9CYAN|nr:DNA sulfur modification protein DndE [Leptolyngbya sp. NK1-12]WNZ26288.1 DNA sulfur modification protein DndE [Leptolyngbya sp. NK1-12]
MEPPVERVRISQAAKDQLIKLKRTTKIDQWNILCRWAFCRSLAEPTPPSPIAIPADSNVEMTWQIFGGGIGDLLAIALRQRCYKDGMGTDPEVLATQFRLHLHRGIGYLAADSTMKGVESIIRTSMIASHR